MSFEDAVDKIWEVLDNFELNRDKIAILEVIKIAMLKEMLEDV